MYTRAWVDFNAIANGRCVTLRKYIDGTVTPGEHVTAFDGEGLACDGVVESLNDGRVTIALDTDSFTEEAAAHRSPVSV